jgi:predicted lipoprotein
MPLALACLAGCSGGGSGTPGRAGSGGNPGSGGSGNAAGGGAGGDPDAAVAFSTSALLAAFGTCAADRTADFRVRAAALDAAVKAYVATPDDASRAAARQAFRDAMDSWQVIDMMQFGPTAPSAVIGGKDFRDNIYSFPQIDRCRIEEAIVARTYAAANFETVLFADSRGLGAIEYLLFYEGADTACGAGSPAKTAWSTLTAEDREARKRAYAAAAAAQVLAQANALDAWWDPAQMNFVQTMRSAGPGNPVYRTPQAAIETVGLALFYVDQVIKDLKLTAPIDSGCVSSSCLESRYAGRSKANIRANVDGLRRILEGCGADHAGLGFDDMLADVGATALADTLRAQAIAVQAALDAIEEPDLDQALAADSASVVAVRDAIGTITTTIKTQFYTTLSFEPSTIPTDND